MPMKAPEEYRVRARHARELAAWLKHPRLPKALLSVAADCDDLAKQAARLEERSKQRAALPCAERVPTTQDIQTAVPAGINDLQWAERHIVSAYERIQRQRQLIGRLGRHSRSARLKEPAEELLGIMQDICREYRLRRKFIQRFQQLH